jgi:hypothetical protein
MVKARVIQLLKLRKYFKFIIHLLVIKERERERAKKKVSEMFTGHPKMLVNATEPIFKTTHSVQKLHAVQNYVEDHEK